MGLQLKLCCTHVDPVSSDIFALGETARLKRCFLRKEPLRVFTVKLSTIENGLLLVSFEQGG